MSDSDTIAFEVRTTAKGEVVVYGGESRRADHDHATCSAIARAIAAIKGYVFAGEYGAEGTYSEPLFFVPTGTVTGVEHARALGIENERDLFGGVVPHPFVGTKCISHPLVDERALAPDGWAEAFGRDVRAAVLDGYAAFSADDALRAGLRLLGHGPVRIKRALGIGGYGQIVVTDRRGLEQALADADPDEVSRYGISLEEDLADVTTHSVGQARLDDLVATYCGTQRLAPNNHGHMVYGGSDLLVARGGFDALLALNPAPAARCAVEQARLYDSAAFARFAGLFASRRNYDVAEGTDAAGRRRSGVLEQSWRIGGASGAEIAALAAFRDDPSLDVVHASSTEIYGPDTEPPPDATIHFQGVDNHAGPLTKYVRIARHVHP
jgi:hypothetical protein